MSWPGCAPCWHRVANRHELHRRRPARCTLQHQRSSRIAALAHIRTTTRIDPRAVAPLHAASTDTHAHPHTEIFGTNATVYTL